MEFGSPKAEQLKSVSYYLLHQEQQNPERIYLKQARHGQWGYYTWAQVMRQARQVAAFLQHLGLPRGAHVAIFSKNCAEWVIADFGICLAGMVNVSLFPNQHEQSIHYVLEHANVQLIFIGKLDHYQQVRKYIPTSYPTVNFDYHPDMPTDHSWAQVLAQEPLQTIVSPEPDEIYTIIYSSGTSETPKGAVFTHQTVSHYLQLFPDDISRVVQLDFFHLVSYLPLVHVYERSVTLLGSLTVPSDIAFIEELDTFVKNLHDIQPSLFTAVPRVWDVYKHKIESKFPIKGWHWLLNVPYLSHFIKSKIKYSLGLESSVCNISGAAHLPASTSLFFEEIGMIIQEGYGQTENLAYCTISTLSDRKSGFVGAPRLQVEIKLGEQDELLMKSPCLMQGYYQDEKSTKAAFTEEGWLRTGDIAEIDAKQRVKIVGRLSDNFKNQKGEFIVPAPIETQFFDKELIEHLCLVGRELVSNLMLVKLTKEAQRKPREEVTEQLQNRMHQVNRNLANYEKISHVLVVLNAWTIDNDLLTPTLKIKRHAIEMYYRDFIQRAILQHQIVVWE